ncbi:MAG TPA: hypothetical protein VMB50_15695 [Myxococcales bacterium]|nr:hypothetical protein [Myxococcales bacterium]
MNAERDELLPADFADRVLARVDRLHRRARRLRALGGLAGLAVVAAVVALPHRRAPVHSVGSAAATVVAELDDAVVDSAGDVDEDPGTEFFPDSPDSVTGPQGQ